MYVDRHVDKQFFLALEKELEERTDYNYKDMIRRDKRRWEKADKNGDSLLVKEEYRDFLHPEETDHMKDVVVEVKKK
jgi:hypothetical protein